MKLNEPVIKLCSKSLHYSSAELPPPGSTLCGIFVSPFSRFLFIFLICFLWFTANFTLGVWLRVGSIACRGVDAAETPQKRLEGFVADWFFNIEQGEWGIGGDFIVIGLFKGLKTAPKEVTAGSYVNWIRLELNGGH